MFERIKQAKEKEGGFTLIELLVVIVILGILAAVVVFAVQGVGDKGQKASCKIDTRTIRTAEEAYFASETGGNGHYGNMAALSPKFLSETSKLHDAVPNADDTTGFTITVHEAGAAANAVDKCGVEGHTPGQTLTDY